MCSPGGVWSILKRYPSHYRYVGDKLWKFIGAENKKISVEVASSKKRYSLWVYFILLLVIVVLLLLGKSNQVTKTLFVR